MDWNMVGAIGEIGGAAAVVKGKIKLTPFGSDSAR